MTNTPSSTTCPYCGDEFLLRSNKKFCSPSCRKLSAQQEQRKKQPVNAANSPTERRKQYEVYELASRMAETLYSMPPAQRLGYIEEIIQLARSGECPRVRQILTMPALIRPNPDKKYLFRRGCKSYCTISQAADRYCRSSPWNAGVAAVVRGEVPDPPTGEIVEEVAEAA
ncbi:hypothetical protein OIU14_02315 [Thalassobacter stenotrophicus]|uniref:hypothetical protein n=1 Tax=Thalassobacter stenotrophicus TaxID=266809 RepID=UPI0022A9CFA6|nr:hypothetical protein [Thalassobacter stenotrophicus]UYP68591.1 hypothetical protein OIU14_02315 [Thalassobacter stenotrophicus]